MTLVLLAAYGWRHVPTPGIDAAALAESSTRYRAPCSAWWTSSREATWRRLTVFRAGDHAVHLGVDHPAAAHGVIPRSALAKGRRGGQEKITQYTRYGTIGSRSCSPSAFSVGLESMRSQTGAILVPDPGWGFRLMTCSPHHGTALIMWLGEQISRRGSVTGVSLSSSRVSCATALRDSSPPTPSFSTGELKLFVFLGLIIMMVW